MDQTRHSRVDGQKRNSDSDFGGLTQKEVDALNEIDSAKAKIITCKDSDEFFKKLEIQD